MRRAAVSFILLFAGIALARPPSDTLSVEEAVETALRHNPNVAIAELDRRQAEVHTREVRAGRYPSLLLHSHYLHTPETGYNEAVTNGGEYALQLTASVPLYDGGIRSALIDQSVDEQERSQAEVGRNRSDLVLAVRTAYFETVSAREEVAIRMEIVGRLEDYLSLLRRLKIGGGALQSDILKTQVDLNNALIAVDVAGQSLVKSTNELKNLTGTALDTPLETLDPRDGTDTSAVPFDSVDASPDLRVLERQKASAEADVRIAQGERYPTLSISGDAGALGVTPREFSDDMGYSILVSLGMPLFDWGEIGARISQKELARDRIDLEIQARRREIESAWKTVTADYASARKTLKNYETNITSAEENYLSAKSRFAGGSGTSLEVLDAQRLLGDARLSYNATLLQLRVDRATMLRLSGNP